VLVAAEGNDGGVGISLGRVSENNDEGENDNNRAEPDSFKAATPTAVTLSRGEPGIDALEKIIKSLRRCVWKKGLETTVLVDWLCDGPPE
jgi:hypothetical protein